MRRRCPDSCILPGVISVVVPAHDEARVIDRLLGQLTSGLPPEGLDVVVVANGCTDDTAQIAGRYEPGVRVLSIPVPSKREALLAGDQAATGFPRIYVDADVELGSADVCALRSSRLAETAICVLIGTTTDVSMTIPLRKPASQQTGCASAAQ